MPNTYSGGNSWAGAGLGVPLQNAGAPVGGTNAIQTLTFDATGGTFQIGFGAYTTAQIAWSATNATLVANIDAALEALPNVGIGGVVTAVGTMTAGVGTITVTAGGNIAKLLIPVMTAASNSLTGNAVFSIANSTPGVTATKRTAPTGAVLIDTTNGILYQNQSSTSLQPTWVKVGLET